MKEDLADVMSGYIGGIKGIEIEKDTPEETALVVRAVTALQKVETIKDSLALIKSPDFEMALKENPELALAVLGSEKMKPLADALAKLMINRDPGQIINFMVNILKMNQKDAETTLSMLKRVTGDFGSEMTFFNYDNDILGEVTLIPQEQFLKTLGNRMKQTFRKAKFSYQKFTIANALSQFWKAYIANLPGPLQLDDQQVLNAKTIAKFEVDWIKGNIDLRDIDKEKQEIINATEDAAKKPEVRALLTGPTEEPGPTEGIKKTDKIIFERWQRIAGTI